MNTNQQLHICHLVFRFDVGGLERVLLNCVKRLPQSNYRHTIIALTDVGEFAKQLPSNVTTIALHKGEGKDWSIHKKLYLQLKEIKPDVFHTYNLATLEYHPVALLAGVKRRIHAEHGRDIYDPTGSNKKYQLLRRIIAPFVHKIVAVSGELNQWLVETVQLPKQKVQLIHNGIDTDYFRPGTQEEQNEKIIGTVARLSPIKDQTTMLEAFAYFLKQFNTPARLRIVGSGELMAPLQAQAEKLGIQSSVDFLGHKEETLPYYQEFDLFTLSSLGEGIPMTALEAMSTALPIVATNVGGLPELMSPEPNINGSLVPTQAPEALANAWHRILSDKERLASASEASRKKVVEEFSEQAMIVAYENLYLRRS